MIFVKSKEFSLQQRYKWRWALHLLCIDCNVPLIIKVSFYQLYL